MPEVILRPDHIELVEEGVTSIEGVVKRIYFQGETREIIVCAGEYEISVIVGRERRITIGERLFLRPKDNELRLMPIES